MRYISVPFCALAIASLALGGCTDLRRALGMEKVIPDEFAVVSRAPLAIPPDYSLRPPRPGAPPSQEVPTDVQAQQSIFRAGEQQALPPGSGKLSAGESALLRQAGAGTATPHIRQILTQEARESSGPINDSFVDKLLFWRAPEAKLGPADKVIDPQLEAQRLKGGQAAAAASTTTPAGMTGAPVIERRGEPSLIATF